MAARQHSWPSAILFYHCRLHRLHLSFLPPNLRGHLADRHHATMYQFFIYFLVQYRLRELRELLKFNGHLMSQLQFHFIFMCILPLAESVVICTLFVSLYVHSVVYVLLYRPKLIYCNYHVFHFRGYSDFLLNISVNSQSISTKLTGIVVRHKTRLRECFELLSVVKFRVM